VCIRADAEPFRPQLCYCISRRSRTTGGKFTKPSRHGVALVFIAIKHIPLVYASLDGVRVIGAELDQVSTRTSTVNTTRGWAALVSITLASAVFLAGEYESGPRVAVAPLRNTPSADAIALTPSEHRRLAATGRPSAWCSLAALAGCLTLHVAAQAVAAIASFSPHSSPLVARQLCPVANRFRSGAMMATFVHDGSGATRPQVGSNHAGVRAGSR
jgi:hypothetical protein